jgi:hypothetical protein
MVNSLLTSAIKRSNYGFNRRCQNSSKTTGIKNRTSQFCHKRQSSVTDIRILRCGHHFSDVPIFYCGYDLVSSYLELDIDKKYARYKCNAYIYTCTVYINKTEYAVNSRPNPKYKQTLANLSGPEPLTVFESMQEWL